ncbi:hypothetical protein JCM6882_004965 [Rhodosporidiobolus microsporus]
MPTLSALPTELLIHALSFLDPDCPHRISHRRPLYNCCLVSRRVRDCAQPLLWRQVSAVRLSAAAREADPEGLGRHVRVLDVSGTARSYGGGHQAEIASLLRLPGVTDVRACGFQGESDTNADTILPRLTEMRCITLDMVDLGPSVAPVAFPHLTSLSLFDVSIPRTLLHTLLQPHYLPSLRFLHLSLLLDQERDETHFFPTLSHPFLQQLRMLQIDAEDRHCFNAASADGPDALVLSFSIDDFVDWGVTDPAVPFCMRHLHLQYFRPEDILPHEGLPGLFRQTSLDNMDARRQRQRQVLTDLPMFLARSHLSTLLLPLSLRHPALTAERKGIVSACEAKRIEVLWEDYETEPGDMQCLLREEICRWVAKKGRGEEHALGAV